VRGQGTRGRKKKTDGGGAGARLGEGVRVIHASQIMDAGGETGKRKQTKGGGGAKKTLMSRMEKKRLYKSGAMDSRWEKITGQRRGENSRIRWKSRPFDLKVHKRRSHPTPQHGFHKNPRQGRKGKR